MYAPKLKYITQKHLNPIYFAKAILILYSLFFISYCICRIGRDNGNGKSGREGIIDFVISLDYFK